MESLSAENVCRSFKSLLALSLAFFALTACGNQKDRPETITKLRALGVSQAPAAAKPGDSISLTFYLAGPNKLAISATPLNDRGARYGESVVVTPVDASPTESVVGPLSLYSYKAQFTVPGEGATLAAIAGKGYARIRYNVKFTTTDRDEESVVGDTLVYAPGAPQLSWERPSISITKPGGSATAGSIVLEGSIQSSSDESNRVAWFVSSGKVKNRKAKATEWQEAPAGNHAVFFTVRGAKSGAFAIEAREITLN